VGGSWWLRVAVLLVCLGYVAESPGLLVLSALTAVGVGAAWVWNRQALRGVGYQRRLSHRRGFPGEQIACRLRVENRKRLPLAWLRIVDRWPLDVAPEDRSLLSPSHVSGYGNLHLVLSLQGRSRVRRDITLALSKRGVHLLGPAWLASGDGFGLFQSETVQAHKDQLVVFPRVSPLADLGIRPEDPFGVRRSPRRLYDDPLLPPACATIGRRTDFGASTGRRRRAPPGCSPESSSQSPGWT